MTVSSNWAGEGKDPLLCQSPDGDIPVKKIILRIFGPELIRNFQNVTIVARQRENFRVFLAIFLVAQLPPKRGVLVHKNSLASCQRCRHSVEPRTLTSSFKQSNLSAWSCQNL